MLIHVTDFETSAYNLENRCCCFSFVLNHYYCISDEPHPACVYYGVSYIATVRQILALIKSVFCFTSALLDDVPKVKSGSLYNGSLIPTVGPLFLESPG